MALPSTPATTLALLIALGGASGGARAETRQVVGNAGVLGEWELTATVAPSARSKELSGPLTMRHVGLCTQDGPEEKKGEIRLRPSDASPRVEGTLVVDGSECAFAATLDDSAPGTLTCTDRRPVPLFLSMR